LLSRSSDSA